MWTDTQNQALKAVQAWLKDYWSGKRKETKPFFYLGGYAGVGKTTLAKHFASHINGDVLFAAYTGKAALVMAKNGCWGARTIHSLLYIPKVDPLTGEAIFKLNRKSPIKDAALIIIDECSMVDQSMAQELLSFERPILVLGDPGQLPPVSGAGYFTSGKPDFMLTEIHRQAGDNPIIQLATTIRNGKMPKVGSYGSSLVSNDKPKLSVLFDVDQVLVGTNTRRAKINNVFRSKLGYDEDLPMSGERLICLKNDKDLSIFNGGMFEVIERLPGHPNNKFFKMKVKSSDEQRADLTVKVHKSLFTDMSTPHWKMLKGSQSFDFAYGITTHKAQGSQWKNIAIIDESRVFGEHRYNWLYTAVTRAEESVTLYV